MNDRMVTIRHPQKSALIKLLIVTEDYWTIKVYPVQQDTWYKHIYLQQ